MKWFCAVVIAIAVGGTLTMISDGMRMAHESTMLAIEKGYKPIARGGMIYWTPANCGE